MRVRVGPVIKEFPRDSENDDVRKRTRRVNSSADVPGSPGEPSCPPQPPPPLTRRVCHFLPQSRPPRGQNPRSCRRRARRALY